MYSIKNVITIFLLFLFISLKVSAQKIKNQNSIESELVCGDILNIYAKKHRKLEFIKCSKVKDSQIKIEALYRFKGVDVNKVEKYLRKRYHTSPLKYNCCGWETSNYGCFKNKKLEKKGYSNIISIFSGETLQTDKKEVPYFYVTVGIGII